MVRPVIEDLVRYGLADLPKNTWQGVLATYFPEYGDGIGEPIALIQPVMGTPYWKGATAIRVKDDLIQNKLEPWFVAAAERLVYNAMETGYGEACKCMIKKHVLTLKFDEEEGQMTFYRPQNRCIGFREKIFKL